MFLWLCQLGSEAAIWLLSSCHQIWLKANRRWLQGKSAAIGRGRIRRCFSVGGASTVRCFGVITGTIGWQSGETIILEARISQVATSWLTLPGQSHIILYVYSGFTFLTFNLHSTNKHHLNLLFIRVRHLTAKSSPHFKQEIGGEMWASPHAINPNDSSMGNKNNPQMLVFFSGGGLRPTQSFFFPSTQQQTEHCRRYQLIGNFSGSMSNYH